MKMPESFLSRMILACLPFTIYQGGDFAAWRVAALIVAVYWSALVTFWFLGRFFPAGTAMQVFLFYLALLGQLLWQAAALPPFWVLSVFFLFPAGFLEEQKEGRSVRAFSKKLPEYFFERVMTGAGFFVFSGALVAAVSVVRKMGNATAEGSPAVMFFLLFLAAYFWKNQPGSGRAPSDRGTPLPPDSIGGSVRKPVADAHDALRFGGAGSPPRGEAGP